MALTMNCAGFTAPRTTITRTWGGKCAPVPDVIFDDAPEVAAPVIAPAPVMLMIPPAPVRSIKQEHFDNVLRLLDNWAEWMGTGGVLADGMPTQTIEAPDARIHTVEDMEIANDKMLVGAVDVAVWELQIMEREAVMLHYGLNTRSAWRAQFAQLFDQAVESLFDTLKTRISC